jgi:hypothetical protein
MPHPSINEDNSLSLPAKRWPIYSGVVQPPVNSTSVARRGTVVRPASTNNPVVLGRRADSAWFARGGRFSSATAESEVLIAYISAPWIQQRTRGFFTDPRTQHLSWGQPTPPVPSLKARVAQMALAQFSERTMEANVAMRELGKSVKMVSDNVKTGAKLVNSIPGSLSDVRRFLASPVREAAKHWKDAPGKYLEYLYGWKNVMDDTSAIIDHLGGVHEYLEGVGFQLKSKKTVGTEDTFTGAWGWSDNTTSSTCRTLQHEKAGFRFLLPDWWYETLPPTAPFSSGWERTWMSFVLDWALPIGNWLGAMEAMQLSPFFQGGWWSTLVTRTTIDVRFVPYTNQKILSFSHAPRHCVDYKYERGLYSTMGSALLQMPDLRSPLSISHLAQSLSLLTQALKR